MSCARRTTVSLSHEEGRFLDKHYLSLSKLIHAHLSDLMIKQKNEKLEFSRPEQLIEQEICEDRLYVT